MAVQGQFEILDTGSSFWKLGTAWPLVGVRSSGSAHLRECSCIKSGAKCADDHRKPSAGTTSYSLAECRAPVNQALTVARLASSDGTEVISVLVLPMPRQTTNVQNATGPPWKRITVARDLSMGGAIFSVFFPFIFIFFFRFLCSARNTHTPASKQARAQEPSMKQLSRSDMQV